MNPNENHIVVVRGKLKKADYVLYLEKNKPIAIVEAKDNNHSIFERIDYYETQTRKHYRNMHRLSGKADARH